MGLENSVGLITVLLGRASIEQAIQERPQIAEFVDQIRGMVEQGADERIPSGDEIAAELERFLGQPPPEGGEPR